MRLALVWTGLIALGSMFSVSASAQAPSASPGAVLNLFFDCQGGRACRDLDYLRREIPVVNWVRDREVSDLHVLVTSQSTGGGGQLYTMAFIGQGDLVDQDQVLTVGTAGDATDDEQRAVIGNRLKVGLVPYLVETAAIEQIQVSMGPQGGATEGATEDGGSDPVDDPWDYWVFNLRANGFGFGESSQSRANYSTNASANRTTDDWKFDVSGFYNRETAEFQVSDDERVTSLVEDWSASSLLVKSLSPQWSLGARADVGRSTRRNEDFRWAVSPGIEYNLFPYSESSRRSVTLQGLLNVRSWDYVEPTIYGLVNERRVAPSLTFAVNQIAPWGRASVDVTGSQYLHDSALRRLAVGGSAQFRLFKGFSIRFSGNYAWIQDQLFPASEGASTEEILLRQRSLETSFNYFTSIGITYRFGSIFNNVVNPRFGGGDGDRFFF